jgi:hypothetical protein
MDINSSLLEDGMMGSDDEHSSKLSCSGGVPIFIGHRSEGHGVIFCKLNYI